jgi:hypothetical protein
MESNHVILSDGPLTLDIQLALLASFIALKRARSIIFYTSQTMPRSELQAIEFG